MRVALNAFFWGQEHVGSGQYLHHLTAHLRPAVDVALLHPPAWAQGNHLGKLFFEQGQAVYRAYAGGAALLHVPYWAPPLYSRLPVVVTVHDLIPLLLPEYRRSPLARAYTALVCAATRRAAHVIADSQATRRDLITHLRLPPERVTVVYLGVGSQYHPESEREEESRVRNRYALPDRYLLYLGGFDARKNVPLLLRSFARLRERHPRSPSLVIAGRLPRRAGLPRLANSLGVEGSVRFTGWVSEEDKPALYRSATLFVFPSRYEGFGLPVVEAMACGTPVVAFHTSSLPELVGEGGLLVSPQDDSGLAMALSELLSDGARLHDLGESAIKQASRFRWADAAQQTRRVYESVLE
ncbi:MAG: glycosyltransferase family 4 protein [Chloroflexi bacterium]|nr:glycosyltransferase family 4 protein [Chloroflexota bacterium]